MAIIQREGSSGMGSYYRGRGLRRQAEDADARAARTAELNAQANEIYEYGKGMRARQEQLAIMRQKGLIDDIKFQNEMRPVIQGIERARQGIQQIRAESDLKMAPEVTAFAEEETLNEIDVGRQTRGSRKKAGISTARQKAADAEAGAFISEEHAAHIQSLESQAARAAARKAKDVVDTEAAEYAMGPEGTQARADTRRAQGRQAGIAADATDAYGNWLLLTEQSFNAAQQARNTGSLDAIEEFHRTAIPDDKMQVKYTRNEDGTITATVYDEDDDGKLIGPSKDIPPTTYRTVQEAINDFEQEFRNAASPMAIAGGAPAADKDSNMYKARYMADKTAKIMMRANGGQPVDREALELHYMQALEKIGTGRFNVAEIATELLAVYKKPNLAGDIPWQDFTDQQKREATEDALAVANQIVSTDPAGMFNTGIAAPEGAGGSGVAAPSWIEEWKARQGKGAGNAAAGIQ